MHRASDLLSLGAGASFLRNGGGIAFGPDGKLYIATGDFENGPDAQNALSFAGKILRMNDNGSVPADNPTPGSLVFAKGVRNGRGLAVGASGNVYVTDAGSNTGGAYDELNEAPAGGKLGWDTATGNSNGVFDDPLTQWSPVIGVPLIGVLAREEQQVILNSMVAMFLFSALGGTWFPLEVGSGAFATVGRLTPSARAMTGFQNILIRGLGLESVWTAVAVLSAYAVGFFLIAVWRFRRMEV